MHKRPSSSYLTAVASLLLSALAIAQAIWFSQDLLQTTSIVVFMLALVWVYYVLPSVELCADSVLIRNPLSIAEVGFGAIEEVDTRFALKLIGKVKSISAWAAPAPGRIRHRSHSPEDFRTLGLKAGESVRPGDLPSTISGSFALQIRQEIEKGNTGNAVWETKPNWLGILCVVLPLLFLMLAHI